MTLTAEQILSLAPDPASAKAGISQSSQAKWSGLGSHDQALWGLCQGSGKDPYKAQIELSGPAFKCTCPSRKFPCKHGLGLYLLYAKESAAFADSAAPAWVSDWLTSREERSEKKAAKLADAAAQSPEDVAAKALSQQKRQDKRQGNVEGGLAILATWLFDLARDGLAGLRSKPAKDWDAIAARLVDAQAAGLAGRIRRAGLLIYGSSAPGWEVSVARELAQISLLCQAYRRIDSLPADLQNDVRTAVGWVSNQDEALARPGQSGLWQVCGSHTQEEERVSRRACYLRDVHSGTWAVLLQFSAGTQALPPPLLNGTYHQGTLHFYPSATPLRVAFGSDVQLLTASAEQAQSVGLDAQLLAYAQKLAANPFVDAQPMLLEEMVLQYRADVAAGWTLRDGSGAELPVDARFRHAWQLHAVGGGAPAAIFGLWNGEALLPLAATCGGRVHNFDGEVSQ